MITEQELKKKSIVFLYRQEIPLGFNSYKGVSTNHVVSLKYEKYSGSLGIIGMSGCGKTVLMKRIYTYIIVLFPEYYNYKRPAIIFDMQSEDHWRSAFPNSDSSNILWKQGESPIRIKNIKCYAPSFTEEECHDFDKVFGMSLDQFDYTDLMSIGLAPGGSRKIANLIKKNPECINDMNKFMEDIEQLPINRTELSRMGKNEDYSFKEGLATPLNYSSKNNIVDNLIIAYEDKVFVEPSDKKCMNSFIDELNKGNVIIINIHQEKKYYSLYAGVILRDLYYSRRYTSRKKDNTFKAPVVVVEESDELAPNDDSKRNNGSVRWLLQILKRARKYDFYTIFTTQEAGALTGEIKSNNRTWIIGKMIATDYTYFSNIFTEEIMGAIRNLNSTKHEFCIVYPNGEFDTFYACNSLVDIHRESSMRTQNNI